MGTNENCVVRRARKQDVIAVMALIQELAEYEHAAAEVELNAQDLERYGFGKDPKFVLWVADVGSEVVGMALCYWRFSTWKGPCFYLEDLVVRKSHRRMHIGDALFEQVRQYAAAGKAKRLEWQVLDWNEPAIEFYKKKHATLDGEWLNARLTADQL